MVLLGLSHLPIGIALSLASALKADAVMRRGGASTLDRPIFSFRFQHLPRESSGRPFPERSHELFVATCGNILERTMRGRERKDASDSRLPIDGEYGETERSFCSSTGIHWKTWGVRRLETTESEHKRASAII